MEYIENEYLKIAVAEHGAEYVCLEPWFGRCDNKGFRGELPEKYGEQKLEAAASRRISYTITIS